MFYFYFTPSFISCFFFSVVLSNRYHIYIICLYMLYNYMVCCSFFIYNQQLNDIFIYLSIYLSIYILLIKYNILDDGNYLIYGAIFIVMVCVVAYVATKDNKPNQNINKGTRYINTVVINDRYSGIRYLYTHYHIDYRNNGRQFQSILLSKNGLLLYYNYIICVIYKCIYIYIYDDDDIMFICTKIGSCRPCRLCGNKIIK